jgi:hypothetical protein
LDMSSEDLVRIREAERGLLAGLPVCNRLRIQP